MALIIKGEMPKGKCWWHDENGKEHECQFFPCSHTINDCPIIGEIPDEHGDLIDANAVEDKAREIQSKERTPYKVALWRAFDEAEVVLEENYGSNN